MVAERKKKIIDSIDRDILRSLYKHKRALTGNQLSQKVSLTAAAIAPRLQSLQKKGIIKPLKKSGVRTFKRTFTHPKTKEMITKEIKAHRSIHWGIDWE